MFRIKICGITLLKDAQLAMLAGVDAVGLNFYDKSPRCVDLASAEKIVRILPDRVAKVGVFVNSPSEEIHQIVDRLTLDVIQLHGDEPPEFFNEFLDHRIIRAFRCRDKGFERIATYLNQCREISRLPDAALVDAYVPGEYGGTGNVIDWDSLASQKAMFGDVPLILAGGLTPFNVADAISLVQPHGVDTASGVEASPGNKDPLLMKAFVSAAKRAFSNLDSA